MLETYYMETDLSEIQANFKAKNDEDLFSLALEVSGMTPESRLALLGELQRRFQAIKDRTASIQLVHGFYTVFVPRTNIHFPDICPNCLRKGADTLIETSSQTKTRHRVVYVKYENAALSFPYCVNCAKQVRRLRRLTSWPSYCILIVWFIACWKLELGRLAAFWGAIVLSLPFVFLSRNGVAVRLGDFGEDWVECRFRSLQYAEAFASVNQVVAQNTETLREEFEAAIHMVRGISN
jgi:hypothetical protein